MNLVNTRWELLRYKLRYLGVKGTLRVAYLDTLDTLHFRLAKHFPDLAREPYSIQLESTTRCNLKCTMCEISYWTEKGGSLGVENLKRIVDSLPRLRRVDMTGIGEALMNQGVFENLEFLKSRGLYVTMNDNFTMLTEQNARRIIDLGLDQIFLSLDGATKETYEAIRVGANFEKVVANARRLIEMKKRLGKRKPEVKTISVISSTNYREIPDIVDIAHDLGVGMMTFVNVVTFENTTGLDTSRMEKEIEAVLQKTLARAKKLGILVKVELFEKLPVAQCDYPWNMNFVTYDGYVHPCCFTTQTGDRAAQNQRSLGNVVERPYREIWDGETYSAFRRKMAQGILPHQCGHCPKFHGRPDTEAAQSIPAALPLLEITTLEKGVSSRDGAASES